MATVQTITYTAGTAITFDPSSIAQSTTWLVGRACTEIDNTSNLYDDILVNVQGIVGSASAPTAGQETRIYLVGNYISFVTTPVDTLNAVADAGITLTHAGVLDSLRFVSAAAAPDTTASRTYWFQPFSVASFFGGIMPRFTKIYISTSLAGGLAASQSAKFTYDGIKYTWT